jgi:hypothetical protein
MAYAIIGGLFVATLLTLLFCRPSMSPGMIDASLDASILDSAVVFRAPVN